MTQTLFCPETDKDRESIAADKYTWPLDNAMLETEKASEASAAAATSDEIMSLVRNNICCPSRKI